MRIPNSEPKPTGANPDTKTETKTVKPKERFYIQEPTQKEQLGRHKVGNYGYFTE